MNKTVVFNQDITPYMRGDVVVLDESEQKRVNAEAEKRDIEKPFEELKDQIEETPKEENAEAEKPAATKGKKK